jgi:hypothetical protein
LAVASTVQRRNQRQFEKAAPAEAVAHSRLTNTIRSQRGMLTIEENDGGTLLFTYSRISM